MVFVRQDDIIVKRSFLALSDGKPENLPVIMHSNFKFYTVGLQLIFLSEDMAVAGDTIRWQRVYSGSVVQLHGIFC